MAHLNLRIPGCGAGARVLKLARDCLILTDPHSYLRTLTESRLSWNATVWKGSCGPPFARRWFGGRWFCSCGTLSRSKDHGGTLPSERCLPYSASLCWFGANPSRGPTAGGSGQRSLRPAGAETPCADLVDPSPAEPPPLTEAGPPVDEGPQPVVPTIESNPATAGPPIDPPSQPTSSAAPSGQICRDFPQSRATWSPRYSPRSCAYKPVPAAGQDSPSTSTGPS